MTGAIVDLLNGWTLLALATCASLWFGGAIWEHRRAHRRGWLAGRAALRKEQQNDRDRARERIIEHLNPQLRDVKLTGPAPITIRAVHAPHLTSVRPGRPLFDFDEVEA